MTDFKKIGGVTLKRQGDIFIIENFQGKSININDSFKELDGKCLFFENCPNLENIEANNCGLTGFFVDNCSEIKLIECYNNNIRGLDLSNNVNLQVIRANWNKLSFLKIKGCNNLLELECANDDNIKKFGIQNFIKRLYLKDCKKLRKLNCLGNSIKNLDVNHLKDLEFLHCQDNRLEKLDVSGLDKLEELCCSGNGDVSSLEKSNKLKFLKVDGCISLKILDCAENLLEELNLTNLHKLRTCSVRENCLNKLIVKSCPNLKYLDTNVQFIGDRNVFIEKCPQLEKIYYDNRTNFYIDEELVARMEDMWEKHFPKLKIFEHDTHKENPAFMEHLLKESGDIYDEEEFPHANSGYSSAGEENESKRFIPLCSWQPPLDKERVRYLTLSNRRLKGKIIIEGFPNLRVINLGHNQINQVIIKDCPSTEMLIVSYNRLVKHPQIINCPNLKDIRYFGSEDWTPPEETSLLEQEIQTEEAQETENNKAFLLLQRHDNGEDISLDELNEINLNLINFEYRTKIQELKEKKLESNPFYQKWKELQEVVKKINELIPKLEEAINQQDLTQAKKILNKIKEYADTVAFKQKESIIENLEQRLEVQLSQQVHQPNYRSSLFIISVFLLGWIGFYLYLQRERERDENLVTKLEIRNKNIYDNERI